MSRSYHRRQSPYRYSQKAHAEAFAHWLGQDRRTIFEGGSENDATEAAFVDDLDTFRRLLAREGHKPERNVRRWRLYVPTTFRAGAAAE